MLDNIFVRISDTKNDKPSATHKNPLGNLLMASQDLSKINFKKIKLKIKFTL